MAVIVEGPSSLIQKLQSKLAFEFGTMSFVQPQLYLPTSTPAPSQMSDFPQSVQLLFEEIGGTRTSIGTLQETLCGCKDLSSIPLQFKRALDGAFSDLGANHVAVLGFGTGKHLLQASQGHLKSASQDKSLGTSVCDVLESLQKGNFKSVDRDIPVNLSAVKGSAAESIAIVGMSCRVPGAESVDEFWQLLLDGKDMCDKIPERLFKVEDYQSPSYKDKNTMRASSGNFLDRPGFWDPQVFGYDVDMARKLDPQGRLVMMIALEALEKAGYHHKSMSSSTPGNIGTVIGVCSDDYQQNRSHTITEDFVPALLRSTIATRTNRFFGWDGPAVTLDTACSGSLVSIESACSYLLQGKCDAVLSGGVNVLTQPQIFLGVSTGKRIPARFTADPQDRSTA
jgi:Beta-ketoacyl synthase, N-terminal domain